MLQVADTLNTLRMRVTKETNNRKLIAAPYHELKQNDIKITIGDYIYDNSSIDVSKFNEMVAKLASNIPQGNSKTKTSNIECLERLSFEEPIGTVN